MKIVYIADDGTQFEGLYAESKCREYEFMQTHPHLKDVTVYDFNGKVMTCGWFDEEIYMSSKKVVIPSEAALRDFLDVAQQCEYYDFQDFDTPGTYADVISDGQDSSQFVLIEPIKEGSEKV